MHTSNGRAEPAASATGVEARIAERTTERVGPPAAPIRGSSPARRSTPRRRAVPSGLRRSTTTDIELQRAICSDRSASWERSSQSFQVQLPVRRSRRLWSVMLMA